MIISDGVLPKTNKQVHRYCSTHAIEILNFGLTGRSVKPSILDPDSESALQIRN
jgi:hypothetical protein